MGKSGTCAKIPVLQNLLIRTLTGTAPDRRVPETPRPVDQETETRKLTAPEGKVATSKHSQEEGSTANTSNALGSAGKYIREDPVSFGLQVAGVTAVAGAIATLPVLSAAGFSTAGPLVGSTAATWQSSLGLVQAGSAFAWCQSAAMGGAAVNNIIAIGAAGAGVVDAATASRVAAIRKRFWARPKL